jgi:hypothetical protein
MWLRNPLNLGRRVLPLAVRLRVGTETVISIKRLETSVPRAETAWHLRQLKPL